MRKRRPAAVTGAALALVAMTASCGYGQGEAKDDGGVRPAGDSSAADPGAGGYTDGGAYGDGEGDDGYGDRADRGARTGAAKTLAVRDVAELGPVVTDSEGWTLYRFDDDSTDPPASSCEDACADAWPPVPAEDAAASAGIKAEKLGKVERPDGTRQLTLGGWPVYRYAKDTAPGDTKGHGVAGTWNALAPDGKKAGQQKKAPPRDTTQLRAEDDPALGEIVSDAKGRTLYRFDKDSAWPMKSNCTGACLDTWKPAKPVDKDKLNGVARKLVSTYERADGTKQLAIDCWPVYWFTGDKGAGDTEGHGKMGLWWAVTPDGEKASSSTP
ncbi:hypothetical protein DVA86_12490 [Streptomyces armeniacus]|uniref:Lipoprotein n=1 Tax=Streptomyces armeniacus TaxID=83291 RepID=A0A345Y073_9ACTN|nr:SCO0930 family lipoprotein [Streptomyces armeniacus]AXK37289.1 hypothetical protein DVA86_12490 [Streptomyces armeniacus]